MDYLNIAKQWYPFIAILGVVITLLWRLNRGVDGKIAAALELYEKEVEKVKIVEKENLELKLDILYGKMRGRLDAVAKVNSLMAGQVKTLHETQIFRRDEEDDFDPDKE